MRKNLNQLFLFLAVVCSTIFIVSCNNSKKNENEKNNTKQEVQMDDDLRKKVEESRAAYKLATELDSLITSKYTVTDLVVATSVDGKVTITGMAGSDTDKSEIEKYLLQDNRVKSVTNSLTVK